MPNGMRWVGLDVLRELPRPLRAVYEAGPTGYGLVRRARAEGLEMVVCSPGNIERRAGDQIKTDSGRCDSPAPGSVRTPD